MKRCEDWPRPISVSARKLDPVVIRVQYHLETDHKQKENSKTKKKQKQKTRYHENRKDFDEGGMEMSPCFSCSQVCIVR